MPGAVASDQAENPVRRIMARWGSLNRAHPADAKMHQRQPTRGRLLNQAAHKVRELQEPAQYLYPNQDARQA